MASWALKYAAMGWRVYPVEPGGKRPLFTGWLSDATTDVTLINRWWRRDAGAPNVGVVAGARFDVIDIEAPHVDAFMDAARIGDMPATPTARSGGGGVHVYIAPLALGTRRLLLHGVHVGELKGSGGVVVPPSVTIGAYSWLRAPSDVAIAAAPAWLRALAAETRHDELRPSGQLSPSRAIALVAGLYRVVAEAAEGERNAMLFWAACRAAEHGVDRHAAAEILLSAAVKAGLPEREAKATIASGFHR
jgi:Bifunctional DNA primase/polymerase, N-terminal